MKNTFFAVLAGILVVCSPLTRGQTVQIHAADATAGGSPLSATVRLSLSQGSLPDGADFTIAFDSTRVSLNSAAATNAVDSVLLSLPSGSPGLGILSWVNGDNGARSDLFDLLFDIVGLLPSAVEIAAYDASQQCLDGGTGQIQSGCTAFSRTTATVLAAAGGGPLPEPGMTALLGVALSIGAVVTARRRRA